MNNINNSKLVSMFSQTTKIKILDLDWVYNFIKLPNNPNYEFFCISPLLRPEIIMITMYVYQVLGVD